MQDLVYINEDVEQKVLSQMINNNDLFYKINGVLCSEYFGVGLHIDIFNKSLELANQNRKIDYFLLREYFPNDSEYIKNLQLADVNKSMFVDYCSVLRDRWLKRNIIKIYNLIEDNIDNCPADGLCLDIQNSLFKMSEDTQDNIKHISSCSEDVLKKQEILFNTGKDESRVTSGFYDLDKVIKGYGNGELIVIAARPSMGKTSFGLQSAMEISKNKPVYFISLEMKLEELNKKTTSLISERSFDSIDDFNKNIAASRELANLKLFINDKGKYNIISISNSIRQMKHKHKISCVFIDYLGLISGTGAYKNNKVYEVQEITSGLKELAKELDIPIIILSQLNRAVDNRPNKTPNLSDLRDSGSIEQDADIVIMIHREEYYLEKVIIDETDKDYNLWEQKLRDSRGKVDVIVQKNRNGRIGNVRLMFNNEITKFNSLY